ncbi:MAG: helix-hairpin-helix domain-containing protein, partial [Planctomycetaceae bacterium]|nr:helix-hairpin-helix domain-containing protein [Planctomycetaceae bacterium]
GCARDALTRLILPSLERDVRRELTERAETHAVEVFAKNLRKLLVQPPVRNRRILAVDPGFKSGCKLAALDEFGNLLDHAVIYLIGNPERRPEAQKIVRDLIDRHQLSVVAIGNGTACRETEDFFAELISSDELKDRVCYVIVNEAGASVYSTSRVGRDELPNFDASMRGAISIGRRLQDPLSELVKIDPANIGVGLYQHDVKAKHLCTSLDGVVESCVNYVGVDVNTASPALLRYVSGLNQLTARRVYEQRLQGGPFRTREQVKEVVGFGEATFVQAAGFLKIVGGENPLDATWIHPESYEVATRILEKLGRGPADLTSKETLASLAEQIGKLDVPALAAELQVGELLLKDILAQLARPGRDPREDLPAPIFKHGIIKLEDLTPGMELTGTVLNVVDFGCFVDIGMHDSGLVHVSRLADRFIRDPHDVVAVGDIVRVWVMEVDKERRRVSLTMVRPGSERPKPQPKSNRPAADHGKPQPKGTRPAPQEKRPPRPPQRQNRPPHGQQHQNRPPRPPRPKPVIPITEAMKNGKEPMRTFSDLFQFYQQKPAEEPQPAPTVENPPPESES